MTNTYNNGVPFIMFIWLMAQPFACLSRGRRTVAMETGCQNIQLCLMVLKLAFPSEVIGPLYLFPTIYVIFQLTEATVLILLFRCHQRFKVKKRGLANDRWNSAVGINGSSCVDRPGTTTTQVESRVAIWVLPWLCCLSTLPHRERGVSASEHCSTGGEGAHCCGCLMELTEP